MKSRYAIIHLLTTITLFIVLTALIYPSYTIHSPLCLDDICPLDQTKPSSQIVDHHIFILDNDCQTKFAIWVAYKVTLDNINGESIRRIWKKDPYLYSECTLSPKDYKDAYRIGHYDRGHQAPLASFTNTAFAERTNYLSNITPQKSDVNRGAWLKLENGIRKLTKQHHTVFVVTGTLYDDSTTMTPLPHAPQAIIPTGYFKVIAIKQGNELKTDAFIIPQTAQRQDTMCQYQTSIKQVEQESHLTLFPHERLPLVSLSNDLGCDK